MAFKNPKARVLATEDVRFDQQVIIGDSLVLESQLGDGPDVILTVDDAGQLLANGTAIYSPDA